MKIVFARDRQGNVGGLAEDAKVWGYQSPKSRIVLPKSLLLVTKAPQKQVILVYVNERFFITVRCPYQRGWPVEPLCANNPSFQGFNN